MNKLEQYFEWRCWKGLKAKNLHTNSNYIDRLKFEIDSIKTMGFCSYFLIVADLVKWVNDNKIPIGPGRGSGAGSLVVYCLNITKIDPIKYDLYFERFLNPGRVYIDEKTGKRVCNPPDLDLDFCKDKRHLIVEHLINKFGEDNVAHIGTFGTMKAKGAIRDVARALGYSYQEGDYLAGLVLPPIAGKEQSLQTCYERVPELAKAKNGIPNKEYKTILEAAEFMEGRIRQSSSHASGILISQDPIKQLVPLYKGKDDLPVTQFEMKTVEKLGLVKFDILGLETLTILDRCAQLIKQRHKINIDLYSLPIDNIDTYDTLCRGDVVGCFQLGESTGLQELTAKIKPRNIEDLSLIVSLFRPGPIASGMLDTVVAVRSGSQNPEYLISELEPILKQTAGCIVYQEQAMAIAKNLAGFSLIDSDHLRKNIGKKLSDKLAEQRKQFVTGCESNNISANNANKIFDLIESFGDYGFNKCLTADTLVLDSNNKPIKIDQVKQNTKLKSYNTKTNLVIDDICLEVIDCGIQDVYEIELSDGSKLQCTLEHKFLCEDNKKHTLKDILKNNLQLISVK